MNLDFDKPNELDNELEPDLINVDLNNTDDEEDDDKDEAAEAAVFTESDAVDETKIEVIEPISVESEESDVAEEDIKEDVEKKTENELVEEYLRPNARCILCTTPIWSLKLNKAFLDGKSYSEMIDDLSAKFEERTGRALNKSLLHRHFKSHFDARAAAIAEYNKRRSVTSSGISATTAQRGIFKLAEMKYLDELEMFDATAKEMIQKYQELETIIEEKRASGKSFGIDELILKQAQLLNALNKQAISKFKALSRVDLENKQGQFLTQLSFIGNKALSGLAHFGKQQAMITPQEMETIYLNVVIRQMLARLEDPLKKSFGPLPADTKTLFYRELKKAMEGIQEGITADFECRIKTETQRLIENKSKGSQESNT
jgi:hypothetical protein